MRSSSLPSWRWLRQLSWPALRHQAGRQLLALLAIALGVALAYAVQLINASALAEFESASRALSGRADLELQAGQGALSETLFQALSEREDLQALMPQLSAQAQLLQAKAADEDAGEDAGELKQAPSMRVLGLDLLQLAQMQPALLPQPLAHAAQEAKPSNNTLLAETMAELLAADAIYLNEAALRLLAPGGGASKAASGSIQLRLPRPDGSAQSLRLRVAGRIGMAGPPLALMDIAALQVALARQGALDQISLRLQPGISPEAWRREALASGLLPATVKASSPGEEDKLGVNALTRAYRVNLGVLSLMALLVGGFLVFAVYSLSVAQRLPQLALLGVLGMNARQRSALLLAEAALLGLLGSLMGLGLALLLAKGALSAMASGFGAAGLLGAAPKLALDPVVAAGFGALGLATSLLAAAQPLWALRRLAPAQVLKGLGSDSAQRLPGWLAPLLLALAGLFALLPPGWTALPGLNDVPLGPYLAMLCLLLGGLMLVPALIAALRRLLPAQSHSALMLLVRERAHDQAGEAARMLAGVLVALSLSVAMLVMVSSFRASLEQWLAQMLPADLYLRSSLHSQTLDGMPLPPALLPAVQSSGLAATLSPQRTRQLQLQGETVQLLARPLDAEQGLPLVGELAPAPEPGLRPFYVSEAMRDALRLQPGQRLSLPPLGASGVPLTGFVRGVWRDYARQFPALLMALSDYQRWSGDAMISELALWLPPLPPGQTEAEQLATTRKALQALARETSGDSSSDGADTIELAAAGELRRFSLTIFDRSFALTYWLQAVSLGVGLFGIAASLSAQVLARRREFGLLRHLGLTGAQLRRMVVAEALLFSAAGSLLGLLLGLAISAVLIFVLNPQSFHWSMDMSLPARPLAALLASVLAASGLTAWFAAGAAASADAVRAVKEDW
ncbi:ABC transporter permease [Paucibacter sp. APW11]|uniref:ABC transporter permease n=1 Tax=Roseateles aquae TaxID=3077235 RepID=A0ABU3P517_9BURK|nr:ABC transporter permease [Paucibacter sp. APW11]MDT8997666.1 ABC transporter permease [Paucibacter sp. APW11]